MFLLASPGLPLPQCLLRIIVFFMLFIKLAFILFSVCFHFFFQMGLSPVHPVLGLSLYIQHWLVSRIFLYYIMKALFCLYCLTVPISFRSPFFNQYLGIYFFQSYCKTCPLFSSFVFLFQFILEYFPFLSSFVCCHSFFIWPLTKFHIQVSYFCGCSFDGY